ncbi:dihydrolipoyl dehydrogenase [Leptospirillum ferriphilum]|uniref:Dihydrolipoyl dehydrogenase n=1 Tax=Leptospirillum ferriphilum TaxID=178606 RepID=A0A1V3STL7_9BACT|nr:dihydrolipoyl dehydrogenase [Leptospirillum ferriphilum]MCL5259210.1 dihydrolipoyl dehydrogenase [Nitrospirota bacterium]OOH69628.1 dihydrolipoyl dehydrogenase [Leptospirillum ferriphilum]
MEESFDLVVVGGGPAGYVGAIRAAHLGMKVGLVESDKVGGTCLHEGCIPTKVLLEAAGFVSQVARSGEFGVSVGVPSVDWKTLSAHREKVVSRLFLGIQALLRKNGILHFSGEGQLVSPEEVFVSGGENKKLRASHILVATGSRPRPWPGLPFDRERVLDSTDALRLSPAGHRIGIVGGGVVGVEFADIFQSFGGDVTLLEKEERLLPLEDPDLVDILRKEYERRGMSIRTGVSIETIEVGPEGVKITGVDGSGKKELVFDKLLVAIGREARLPAFGKGFSGLPMERGFLKVDPYGWTGISGLYAAGDVTGGLMLAHAASHQAVIAVDRMAGKNPSPFDPSHVPRVVYSHPEVVSVGISGQEARRKGLSVRQGEYPLLGNGRSLIHGEKRGLVRVFGDPETGRVLGLAGVGAGLSELISLGTLAMQTPQGLLAFQGTIIPHPTVGEALWEAAMDVTGDALHR